MPAWTLGEYISTLTKSVGRRADITASDASAYVNRAIQHVANNEHHALMEGLEVLSVGSGTSVVTLPTDLLEPLSVLLVTASTVTTDSALSSFRTLQPVSLEVIDNEGWLPIGEPTRFAFFGNQLELRPSSDTTRDLQVRYLVAQSDLTEEDSVPSLSTPWREAALYKAQELVFKELLDDPAKKAEAQNDYLAFVGALKSDTARRQALARQHIAPVYPRRTYR